MNFKDTGLKFLSESCETWCFPIDIGKTMGPKTEKDLFRKGLKRVARNCQQRGVKRAQHPRWTVELKARQIKWHTVLIEHYNQGQAIMCLILNLHW